MSMIAVSRQLLNRDRQLINDIGIPRGRTLELKDRSDAAIRHLTVLRRAIASGASTYFGFLQPFMTLDENRERLSGRSTSI